MLLCRFRNGQFLSRDATSGESVLQLTSVTTDDSGYYTCRASNDHSSVYSTDAEVIVKGESRMKFVLFSYHWILVNVIESNVAWTLLMTMIAFVR